jgi:hypothetical protein
MRSKTIAFFFENVAFAFNLCGRSVSRQAAERRSFAAFAGAVCRAYFVDSPFLICRIVLGMNSLFLLALLLAGQYQPVKKYDPKRDAAKDIDTAIVEAQRTGKHVLLVVGGEWCSGATLSIATSNRIHNSWNFGTGTTLP